MFDKLTKQRSGDPVAPYSTLAQIYDYVMRHVDYIHWADFIESIFERFDERPHTILELACGTGTLSSVLTSRGYSMTGVDHSDSMIDIARHKAQQEDQTIAFHTGDMVDPPVPGPFDTVLCLYDSVNYLMEMERVLEMLSAVGSRIRPGGLFIFDACTEINSRRFFSSETEREGTDDFAYIRKSKYLAKEHIQINEFQLLLKNGDHYDQHFERHEQRIYPISTILDACRKVGFEIAGTFDGFSMIPASEQSNRVHFVLRKPLQN
jgi:2-polyprenyl-3-methyl-5-hydroxy-6-metoxy-1,4-benzoquinol methylase